MRVTDLPGLWERAAATTVGRDEGAEAQRHTLMMCAKHLKDALSHAVGQEVVDRAVAEVGYAFGGQKYALVSIDWSRLKHGDKLYLAPAVARSEGEDTKRLAEDEVAVPYKLLDELQLISEGVLPDGDGVDVSTGLWAEGWIRRLDSSGMGGGES